MRALRPADAAALVRPVDTLAVPLGPGQPPSFLHALGERDDYQDLRIFGALLLDLYAVFARPGVQLRSGFFGPAERALAAAGHGVEFVPGDFRRFSWMVEELRPRVMATAVAPADEHGHYSLSLHAGATESALRACARDPERLLVAEVNPALPRTFGLPPDHSHALREDEIDILVESEHAPKTLEDPEPSDVERTIAEHVRPFIEDGSTLQTGIGGVPNQVARLLAEGDGGDYGVHSEMFTTGLMHLHRAGKVSNRKGVYDGFSAVTFALGTQALHEWLHENEDVRFLPVELVNAPGIIGRNRKMVSLNGALSIDLAGQIVADTIGGRQYSGIGGHEDFVGGASLALGGHSLVCLPATAKVGGERISRIHAGLPAGAIVTTPRHQVDVVVTEYGAALLRGRTVAERAEALAGVAHPAVREALRSGALELPKIGS